MLLPALMLSTLMVAAPPAWPDASLATAQKASAGKRPILVYVYAHWCTPCNALGNEVIDTEVGVALAKKAAAVRVDFDKPEGQAVTRRFAVLNLPTILVLDAKSQELGRVEGYPGRAEVVQTVKDLLAGERGLDVLEARYADTPSDLDLSVQLGQAYLSRGRIEEGQKLLNRAMAAKGSVAADAARTWGRYLVRVKKDGKQGAAHFLKYAELYQDERQGPGFLFWAAKALHLDGQSEAALKQFDQWSAREPRSYEAVVYKADFMVSNGYDRAEAELLCKSAISLEPEKAWPHYLLAELKLQAGQRALAEEAIRRALAMEPGKAIFLNFAKKRLGLDLGS